MEQFDLYDNQMNKLHKTMKRGDTNQPGEYHLVVHIWMKNSEGAYLIQQRNKDSDRIPFQWAVHGGAVLTGETSMEGAIRETAEEIGIILQPSDLTLLKRYFIEDPHSNYITDLYIVQKDILLNECKIDTVEVRNVAYKTMTDIQQMIQNNTFWDYEHLLERKGYYALLEKS